MSSKQLLDEVTSLPLKDRALLDDNPLLKDLNQPKTVLHDQWMREARHRLAEISSGATIPVAADDVFRNLLDRLQG